MPNPTSKLNLVINGTTTQLDIHDANAVDLTSNQTVGGIKTFSNAPVVNSINLDGKTIDTDVNGNLTYNGHIIDTIEEQGDEYIRYSNGLQICWGIILGYQLESFNEHYGKTVSFPKIFLTDPIVNISQWRFAGHLTQNVNIYDVTTSYLVIETDEQAGVYYTVFGKWK